MAQSTKHDSTEDRPSVVHVVLVDGQDLGEWHPEYHVNEVTERGDVDGDAHDTHLKGTIWWWWPTELSEQDEENGEEVRDVKRKGLKRDESIERCCAGDVDQG